MPCYRAQSNHASTLENKPQIGASWTTYWKECPCCSSSSNSPSPSPSPASSPSPSASSDQAAPPQSSSSVTSSGTTPSSSPSASPTPTQSSSAQPTTASSSSASGGGSTAPSWREYIAYPCSGSNYDSTTCDQWYTLSGGVEIEVYSSNETSNTLYTCAQQNGTTIKYKICRVAGVNALGSGNGCCLLIEPSSLLNAPYTANATAAAYDTCNSCNLNIVQSNLELETILARQK